MRTTSVRLLPETAEGVEPLLCTPCCNILLFPTLRELLTFSRSFCALIMAAAGGVTGDTELPDFVYVEVPEAFRVVAWITPLVSKFA